MDQQDQGYQAKSDEVDGLQTQVDDKQDDVDAA